MWADVTYPFPSFSGATVEVWERLSNFIPHFARHVITYSSFKRLIYNHNTTTHSSIVIVVLIFRVMHCICQNLMSRSLMDLLYYASLSPRYFWLSAHERGLSQLAIVVCIPCMQSATLHLLMYWTWFCVPLGGVTWRRWEFKTVLFASFHDQLSSQKMYYLWMTWYINTYLVIASLSWINFTSVTDFVSEYENNGHSWKRIHTYLPCFSVQGHLIWISTKYGRIIRSFDMSHSGSISLEPYAN